MKTRKPTPVQIKAAFGACLAISLSSAPALAYVGPGLGLATIGAILGGIAAIFLAIVGIFWYPIRSMIRKRKAASETPPDKTDTDT